MTLDSIIKAVDAQILTGTSESNIEATGCYVCDLLSLAMSKVSAGDVWITVQANVNIAAVAVLTEAACVLVAEGMHIDDGVIEKAESQGVVLLRTSKSAFEAALEIGKLL